MNKSESRLILKNSRPDDCSTRTARGEKGKPISKAYAGIARIQYNADGGNKSIMNGTVYSLDAGIRLPRVLSLRDAAAQTGLSYGFLRSLCTSGSVICFRVGRAKWVINEDSLAAYLNNGGSEADRE